MRTGVSRAMAVTTGTEGGAALKPSGKVDSALVEKAVDALLKWSGSLKGKDKSQLLEDDQLLYVVVGLNKVPDRGRTNPYSVTLPHPLFQLDENLEVCLIISDRENTKLKMSKETAKERIEKEGLNIRKVISSSKLKKDYFSFEAKRKLCGSYDLFLADDRILGELPKVLGKGFYKKKKHPIPVNLTRAQWKGQIMSALSSTFVYVSGGTCSVVKVAKTSQLREEIIENVKAVCEGVAQQIPKKWANIRSYYLKTLESISLPIYQSLPDMPFKIDLPGLSQPDANQGMKQSKKKVRLAEVKKEKVDGSFMSESEDKTVVVQDTVAFDKSKKRDRKSVV